MSGPAHDDDLTALHAALARLTPSEGINIPRLLYRAGQASASQRSWAWPCATAAATLLAAAFGAALLLHTEPQPFVRVVRIQEQSAAPLVSQPEPPVADQLAADIIADTEPAQGGGDYLRLREQVLAKGVEALPSPAPWPAAVQPEAPNILLDIPRGASDPGFPRRKQSL